MPRDATMLDRPIPAEAYPRQEGIRAQLLQAAAAVAAATGMIAGPEHAIRVVRHLLECNGPKDVGRFALAWGRGQPGQEMAHQIGQRPEDFGIPVIAGHGRAGTVAQIQFHRPIKPQTMRNQLLAPRIRAILAP